jgi:fatty acid desaturase
MVNPEEVVKAQEWFTCDIARQEMKSFLQKDDYHAWLNILGWIALMAASGYLAIRLYPSAWAIPAFFLYGLIYSSNNAKWHECSHGTAFKTLWLNDLFYFICGAMELRDAVDFRWSHARHHSYTIITGVDAEIAVPRPPRLLLVLLDCFYIRMGYYAVRNLILHSLGVPAPEVRAYVPETDFRRMFWSARAVLALQLVPVVLAILLHSWLPVLFFGLPRFYGAVVGWAFIVMQHVGLAENVWDHRLNTRSLHFNFILTFLYMHMENHIQHHMYPLVPFHALPRLRERVQSQMPRPYRGMIEGFRELLPILFKQRKDPSVFIRRPIPGL